MMMSLAGTILSKGFVCFRPTKLHHTMLMELASGMPVPSLDTISQSERRPYMPPFYQRDVNSLNFRADTVATLLRFLVDFEV